MTYRVREYLKFHFDDFGLSAKVRARMYQTLIPFDVNHNRLFEKNEIIQALVSILHEDRDEVRYFINNVFRYDKDGDGNVTDQQFVNFCVQQHFGEMAIQRLHRKGYYSNGARRVMNLQEFEDTLDYCLGIINSKGTHQEYDRLFNEVDLDYDGWISYQDYFMFLKEYFGSKSEVTLDEQQPAPPQPKPQFQPPEPILRQPEFADGNVETPQERFAKLIYAQLKILVMNRDRNRNMELEPNQVEDILSNVFQMPYFAQNQLTASLVNNPKYEDFMKKVMVYHICEVDANKNNIGHGLNKQQFIEAAKRVTRFAPIAPADHVLEKCFASADLDWDSKISQNEYKSLMKNIFMSHEFDKRGLPNKFLGQLRY